MRRLPSWSKNILAIYYHFLISVQYKPEFVVLPKRWIVERTFSWMNNSRRLSKDYEITVKSEEIFIAISQLHVLLCRLAKL